MVYDNIHLVCPSSMYKEINTENTKNILLSVLEMIGTDNSNIKYGAEINRYTFEEELFTKRYLREVDISKSTSAIMLKSRNISNNLNIYYRFIFFSNIESFKFKDNYLLEKFVYMNYSMKSGLDDTNNNFITYFISNSIKDNDEYIMKLIISIIKNIVENYISEKYNIFDFNPLYSGIYYSEISITDYQEYISTIISFARLKFEYFDSIFTILDSVFNLRYEDEDNVCSLVYGNKYKEEGIDIIYRNAITLPRIDAIDKNTYFTKYFYNNY